MHRGRAGPLQLGLQQQIEHIEVNADEQVDGPSQQFTPQPQQQAQQARQLEDRLPEAVDGQLVEGGQGLQAGRAHGFAANPDEAGPWQPAGQGAHQAGAEPIPRRLAGDHADGKRFADLAIQGRSPTSRKVQ